MRRRSGAIVPSLWTVPTSELGLQDRVELQASGEAE